MDKQKRVVISLNPDGTLNVKVENWVDMTVTQMERMHYEIYRAVQGERSRLQLKARQAQSKASEVAAKKDDDFIKELANVVAKDASA